MGITLVYAILVGTCWYTHEFDLKTVCIGILFVLIKLDTPDSDEPKWYRLTWRRGEGWRFRRRETP
jgi:hypothetical protein